jgi:hypothetical protein
MIVSNLEFEFKNDPEHKNFLYDLRTNTYSPSVGVQVTHIPTGITELVCRYPMQHRNRIEATNLVYRRVIGKPYQPKGAQD